MIAPVLVRFAYLAVSHAFAALWLLRMSNREKDVEILALRHQLVVLRRQFGGQRATTAHALPGRGRFCVRLDPRGSPAAGR
jgi:hypothetical protein